MLQENLITGEKFVDIADFVFSVKVPIITDYYNLNNTYNVNLVDNFNGTPIIYTQTSYVRILFSSLKNLKKDIILITHNSDINITEEFFKYKPENVIKWYGQNVAYKHEQLESLPIGLENSIWFPHVRKKDKIIEFQNKSFNNKNLLYVNHKIETNRNERAEPYVIFKDKSYITLEYGSNGQNYESYLTNMKTHKFILCPDGNGIDTHRLWEALYIGCIPIVKKSINTEFYKKLPICYVENWQQIDEKFLNDEYQRISNEKYDLGMLNFEFWKKKIKTYENKS